MGARPMKRCDLGSMAPSMRSILSKKNAAALRRKLAPFIEHSRKAGRGQRRRGGRTGSSRDRSGSIRAWAQAQGIAVSARGRIPASVVEQYQAVTQRP
jgi:Lsr2